MIPFQGLYWYVLQTKPQREATVFQLLHNGGFEAFLPKILISERIKSLFPSYLFLHSDLSDNNHFKTIRYTRGVNKIVGGTEGPIPIEDAIVEAIRERIGEKGYIEQGSLLKPGDKVIVKKGILKDLMGILEKPVDDKGRVEVFLKILNNQMKAKIHCKDLERLT